MKILDPQSSVLPTVEVARFLASKPRFRPHDPKIGGYPTPNLRGYRSITKEINDYLNKIAGHVRKLPDLRTGWMEQVVGLLSRPRRETGIDGEEGQGAGEEDDGDDTKYGYGLTKGEVLMVVELGLGMGVKKTEPGGASEEAEEEEADDQMQLDEQEASDTQVLHAVVEELSERFTDDEISELLQKIRAIIDDARLKEADLPPEEKPTGNGNGNGHGHGYKGNNKGKGKNGTGAGASRA